MFLKFDALTRASDCKVEKQMNRLDACQTPPDMFQTDVFCASTPPFISRFALPAIEASSPMTIGQPEKK